MEAVAALFATVATTAVEGTAFLAPLVTTTTSAAASTTLGVLQGAATTASLISSIVGGVSALGQGVMQSQLSEMEAGQLKLASEQRALEIRKQHVKAVGATRVAFAGSGLDLSSADAIEADLQHQADYATSIERTNATMRAIAAQRRGDAAQVRGYADLAAGVGKGFGTAADYALDLTRRG